MSLVELRGVTRHVLLPDDSRLDILRGIDLTVDAGDHVAIVGRSGSGKSTLLNILGMLDLPSSGSVAFRGEPVARENGRRMRRGALDRLRGREVGFVFQQFNLLPGRSATDNVAMPLGYATGRPFWHRRRLAEEMLERVGLGHRLTSPPEQLSGGEQQRVAIARALVRRPALILADEPTGALDLDTGEAVMSLLDEVASETEAALVTITHDLHVAARARRHYRLDGGILSPVDLEEATRTTAVGAAGAAESADATMAASARGAS
ncbi:ABC transporter ATP-binding protein [Microbacterium dextranolyticum]|uniref:Macrolide export ATP-binding/permease protein MacB n=1 Tax=Microbacterium dextranolyticum TaxID=36806 RepID=A0A9W6M796_9MICO|nr:ABC transporter ATP-binding protein [Microbacterium dextranolyticum]MBM7463719.1 putative ABC transport system ATP-binding protein [Microbacterium dextranolyticum]GLJ96450.1 macrolide export ATP-binding/permease protein MacB [Microbacterium dextranolyticum]